MALNPETFVQLRDSVRRFVRERLVPHESEVGDSNEIPEALLEEMRELGLYGLTIPPEFGGLGLNSLEEVQIAFELGWTSPAFRSAFGTNVGIGSQGIVLDGTDVQRDTYLPRLASGEITSSFALTEPNSGSDAGALHTSAQLDGDHYIINGTKRFITNSPRAGLFTLMARTNPNERGARGVSAFLVEAPRPGLTIGKPDKKMGQHGSLTADVIFDDCRVPTSALLGGVEGRGFKTAMKVLDRGRLHISAVATGIAERLVHQATRYAMERQQFGKPISEFQLVQAMLADSRTESYAARTMIEDAARRRDQDEDITEEIACCKLYATEMVGRVADRAVQIHGGAGYIADHGIERFYRDVRLFRLYEGTSEIQRLIIARSMVKRASV
ncbi:acyl-CoA dehydrogenase family protein [bacterium]|nr:acyl-CoA dehydrogenase family protein [bacterium]